MDCLDVELGVVDLAEDGFAGGNVDESDANRGRDATGLAHGTYDLMALTSANG